ncbi:MAG: glycosyltransferase [Gemmatimonadota bacterium]
MAPGFAGGLESVVSLLAVGHRRQGHKVLVVSALEIGQPDPTLHAQLEAAGVEVVRLYLPPRAYRRERTGYADAFTRFRADVVHTHGYRADLVAGGAARRAGLPLVTTVHGFTGGDWKNRLYERIQLRAFRRFDAVVAVSESVATRLRATHVPGSKVVVIPNAFDATRQPLTRDQARRELGISPGTPVIGWVGRLSREKGLDVLLEAMSVMSDRSVTLSVLGDGREKAALVAQANSLGIDDRIKWHGMIPDAGRFYRAFDAYVLSSRTEGTPISLFEAMAAGVPVVATAVGGVPDVVSTVEAVLVPPESPVRMARAIEGTLEQRNEAAIRVTLARARLDRSYALEPWLKHYEQLYRTLTTMRGSR